MINITIKLDDADHIKLLELQLERKRMKKEPTAVNKIAAELIREALNKKAN